jgi:hypothetical protein
MLLETISHLGGDYRGGKVDFTNYARYFVHIYKRVHVYVRLEEPSMKIAREDE